MNQIQFNFNDMIKVRLTPTGVSILQQQHDELNHYVKSRGGRGLGPLNIKVDEDGFTSFQFWSLIETFGEHVCMTKPEPFHGEIILCINNIPQYVTGGIVSHEQLSYVGNKGEEKIIPLSKGWIDEFNGNAGEVSRRIEEGRKAMESKESPLLSKKSVDKSTL